MGTNKRRPDLITLATLVFYADVGLFQYIVKVGLVSLSCTNLPNQPPSSNTFLGQTSLGRQRSLLFSDLSRSLDFRRYDLLHLYALHQNVNLDVVSTIVSHQ